MTKWKAKIILEDGTEHVDVVQCFPDEMGFDELVRELSNELNDPNVDTKIVQYVVFKEE